MNGALINKLTEADSSPEFLWSLPPVNLRLESGEADVWLVELAAENTAQLEDIISEDERARAKRFKFSSDKNKFVAARAFLRIIIGKYLQINPREIRFEYNKYGKPSISAESQTEIKFNLSHTGNLALLAVSRNREIGADIERINSSFVDEQMALQCLTKREIKHFQTLSGSERNLFFFKCWTLKEAYLKACGKGLSIPANRIETLSFSEISGDLFENNSESRQVLWSLQQLPSIPGYASALAVESPSARLRFWRQSITELPY